MKKKIRLDSYLTENKYYESKSKAQAGILAGDVKLNGETIHKSSYLLDSEKEYNIEIKSLRYVSRGGLKIEKALKTFKIDLVNRICLDAGASTGGFTDCMLKNKAKYVYSVDVGYGQLAWVLRNCDKVKVVERTNIKNCDLEDIYDPEDILPTFCAMDLSFISIIKVLENIKKLMNKEKKEIVALIKPQFEAGKESVGKNGVVRDKRIHIKIIIDIIKKASELNFKTLGLDYSPIKGPKGNIEYLIHLEETTDEINNPIEKFKEEEIELLVNNAFENLNKGNNDENNC